MSKTTQKPTVIFAVDPAIGKNSLMGFSILKRRGPRKFTVTDWRAFKVNNREDEWYDRASETVSEILGWSGLKRVGPRQHPSGS